MGAKMWHALKTPIPTKIAFGVLLFVLTFAFVVIGWARINTDPSHNFRHAFLTYPWYVQKILPTFVFSAPVPLPQPTISPEAALALVEKRPGVQKWLAAFGGKVGGVDPRLGHIASIGITSETASTYTIEIAEITQTLTVADGWYSVNKMTGVVTNVSY